MEKKVYIYVLFLLLCLCGCEPSTSSTSASLNAFEAIEGSQEDGYTVKDLTWGMTEDEVRESLNREDFEADTDRLIYTVSEDDDLQYTELYYFEDDTRSSLVTVEYSWGATSEDSFQSVVNSLYESASQQLSIPDNGGTLTQEMLESGVVWTASDNSNVRVISSPDQNIISVQISCPREIPKTLMPSS